MSFVVLRPQREILQPAGVEGEKFLLPPSEVGRLHEWSIVVRHPLFCAWITAVAISMVALPAAGQTPASCNGPSSEEVQILALEKKLAEQNQRINQLEQQVRALLGGQKTHAAAGTEQSSKPMETTAEPKPSVAPKSAPAGSSAAARAGAEPKPVTPGPVKAVSATAHQTKPKPENRVRALLSPIHFGGNDW